LLNLFDLRHNNYRSQKRFNYPGLSSVIVTTQHKVVERFCPDDWQLMDWDGSRVYTGGDDDFVRVWDAANSVELGTFSGDGKDIYGIALNPQGDVMAMGNQDGEIILWDLISGEKVRTMSGHTGLANRITFSRDGSQIASANFDRLAKVWNVDTGEEIASLYGNTSNVFGVSFSPDGQHLATAGADGTIRIYETKLSNLIDLTRSRINRSLTDDECRMYLHVDVCP
jgi:WD40 repeat protein